MDNLGESIKQLRKAKGLTQKQVSQSLGISQSAYCKWESGQKIPSVNRLEQIGRILSYDFVSIGGASRGASDADDSIVNPASTDSPVQDVCGLIPVVDMGSMTSFDPVLSKLRDLWSESSDQIPYMCQTSGQWFGIRIQGDDIAPYLLDGDIVAVSDMQPITGCVCIALHRHDGLLCVRWFLRNDVVRLEAIGKDNRIFEWTKADFIAEHPLVWCFCAEALVYRRMV